MRKHPGRIARAISRNATRTFTVFVVMLLCNSYCALAQAPDEQEVIKNLGQFGITLAGVAAKATQAGTIKAQTGDPSVATPDLDSIARGYTFSRDMNRGVVALLNTNAEVVFTGIDVVTEGASLIATGPLRIAKDKALDALSDKMQGDARQAFAKDISQYVTAQHLDYDSLSHETPDQIKSTIDNIPAVRDLKSQLGGDEAAQDVVDRAVVGMIVTTQKAQLDQIAQNTADIDANKREVLELGQSLNDYKNEVSSALDSFQGQLSDVQTSVQTAQDSIADLNNLTQNNIIQIGAVGDVMFSKASAQDRLTLLQAGFKKDELSSQEYDSLVQATEADAKREAAQAQMQSIVQKFGEVTKIADNLGIHIDGLDEAASIASTATTVVSDVMSGDFLGAVVGVTGLFGHQPDPEAIFRQQLMHYLDANFKQVNQKLDTLIKGQQQIMAALSGLSDQLATYDKLMHSQLDRIEFKLDTIQDLAEQQFYLPYGYCNSVENHVRTALSGDYPQVDLRSFDQMAYLLNPAGQTFATVHGCIDFMDLMFQQTLGSSPFHFTPLAYQYSHTHSPAYVVDPQKVADYTTDTQAFMEGQYKPTTNFFLAELKTPISALGVSGTFNEARALADGAVPAVTVPGLIAKLTKFSESHPSCAKDTLLSEPLIAVLCSPDGSARYLNLTSVSQPQQESGSENTADTMLKSALMFDALDKISEWAEFFAPVWDYADEEHQDFFKTAADFLSQAVIKPKGIALVNGALRVDTIAISQMNMLYGDHLAAMVFNELWSNDKGLLSSRDGLSGQQATAAAMLASGNPYLTRNVLMLALDKSRKGTAPGRDLSYGFALDYMKTASSHPDAQLQSLFQGKIMFKNIWKAIDPTTANGDASCTAMADGPDKLKSCTKVPVATVAGVDVTLPSVDQFTQRALVYPNSMVRLIRARDSLAAMAAEYQALDYAAAKTGKDRAALAASMAQTFR